jgi:hypothetical protein
LGGTARARRRYAIAVRISLCGRSTRKFRCGEGSRDEIEDDGGLAAAGFWEGGTALRWSETVMPDVGWHVHEMVHRLSLVSVQTMLAVHALLILSG